MKLIKSYFMSIWLLFSKEKEVVEKKKSPFLLPLDLQLFAEDPNDPPADPPPADPPGKTFTQEELDKIVADRLAREKKKFADYDEKAKKLEELEKAEADRKKSQMDEAERLKLEKEEADKKALDAEEKVKKAQEAANQRILNTEIKSIARALNANDPTDVLALLDKSSIEIDDEGDVKGVEEAVKALKETKPWMFKAAIGADAGGGGNPAKHPNPNELTVKEKELADLKEQALKNPRLAGKVTKLFNEILELRKKK
ncbi:phage scaffolding protein [Neobacillus sp. NPDC093127]|uniref:phage scaffolding protein n=1 Tax=Neobacillus sp. NPDC093127 TaxID=3364296 RepID=UPI00381D6F27